VDCVWPTVARLAAERRQVAQAQAAQAHEKVVYQEQLDEAETERQKRLVATRHAMDQKRLEDEAMKAKERDEDKVKAIESARKHVRTQRSDVV
jgi:cytochrome c-type biogenesis protein CcmH/NrfG